MNDLSKQNKRLFDLCGAYIGLFDRFDDMDTREGYIVFNIKTHGIQFKDRDDLLGPYLVRYPSLAEALEDEFDDNRLDNIFWHCAEMEVSSFKDDFMQCAHLCNNDYWLRLMDKVRNDDPTGYPKVDETKQIWRKLRILEKWRRAEHKERHMIDLFDHKDVYTWGRSCGWISIARYQEWVSTCEPVSDYAVTVQRILQGAASNDQANKDIREELDYELGEGHTKADQIRFFSHELERIQGFFEAYDFIEKHIKLCKEGFGDLYADEVKQEIETWISNEGALPEHILYTESMMDWIQGRTDEKNWDHVQLVRRQGDEILTSLGVKVKVDDVKKAMTAIQWSVIDDLTIKGRIRVGNYSLDRIHRIENNDFIVKAGCHIMLKSNFDMILNS